MTTGERLFKDVMTDEDEEDQYDQCMMEDKRGSKKSSKPRSFTLCMICNPSSAGYDQLFTQWKQSASARNQGKKIVVNSSGY